MARVFITGSADGLGRATAQTLLGDGHEIIVHARSAERLTAVNDLIGRGASAVVGDLADLDRTRALADEVNQHGLAPLDALEESRSRLWTAASTIDRTCGPR